MLSSVTRLRFPAHGRPAEPASSFDVEFPSLAAEGIDQDLAQVARSAFEGSTVSLACRGLRGDVCYGAPWS